MTSASIAASSATSSWFGSTTADYKFVDFDPNRPLKGTDNMSGEGSSVVTTLLSFGLPETSTWSSLLATTLAENLTTFTNSTDLLSDPFSLNQDQQQLMDPLGRCDNGSDTFNCTVQEYMEYMRGPQTLPLQQAIFVSTRLLR